MDWWAETDRLHCVNGAGELVELIVRQHVTERTEGLTFEPPVYVTSAGEPVTRLGGDRFQLRSGEMLRRFRR